MMHVNPEFSQPIAAVLNIMGADIGEEKQRVYQEGSLKEDSVADIPQRFGSGHPGSNPHDERRETRPRRANPAAGNARAGMPSWYTDDEEAYRIADAARLNRAHNPRNAAREPAPDPYDVARAELEAKNADRLWTARQAQASGIGYYDEGHLANAAVSGREPGMPRHERRDLQSGDQYHQQITKMRASIPDAPTVPSYRDAGIPPVTASGNRQMVGMDEASREARQMQANRRRAQARTRSRHQKNLFSQQRKRKHRRIIFTVVVVALLIIALIFILTNAGSCAPVSS